ncbi:hypothetical protein AB1Y20_002087 [Prymnesium parvum]|uniref:DDHD domain-containing protein n=1 Tax=Prymnesium parvum TaxID=97485 RepID=A0AB34JA42_PRYPA
MAWLRQEADGRWLRLHEHDEAALDAAIARGAREVPICGGRVLASLHLTPDGELDSSVSTASDLHGWAGVLRTPYFDTPPLALTRSTWCYKSWPNGEWTPFIVADDVNLEAMWKLTTSEKKAAVFKGSGLVTLDARHRINVKRKADGSVSLEMQPTDRQMSAWLDGRVSWSVERGWGGEALPRLPAEQVSYDEMEPSSVVLLVHGIGETLWRRHGGQGPLGFVKSSMEACAKLRSIAALAQAGWQARLEPHQRRRTEFLPVEWREGAVDDDTALALSHVTPHSVPVLRQFANEVILDVLLYEQAEHRQRIQQLVTRRINAMTSKWRELHPTFDSRGGSVVLLGHSLGSLICYDILSTPLSEPPPPSEAPPPDEAAGGKASGAAEEVLLCRPSACVALGSPVGCFLALRHGKLGASFSLPRCLHFYNVFHRSDPVAYRLEPLLCDHMAAHDGLPPPAYVPFAGDKGGERLHVKLRRKVEGVKIAASAVQQWLGDIGDSLGQTAAAIEGAITGAPANIAAGPPSSEAAPAPSWAMSAGERVDWMLQETELEVANEYLSALQAHTAYFENADVVQFICDYVIQHAPTHTSTLPSSSSTPSDSPS